MLNQHKLGLLAAALVSAGVAVASAGCGGDGETPSEVVLLTHDSFAVSKEVRRAFEQESGLTLRILQAGDANETLNRALLTAGDPQGDVIFGIDDSVLSRALEEDLLEEYRSEELEAVAADFVPPDSPRSRRSTTARCASMWIAPGSRATGSRRRSRSRS